MRLSKSLKQLITNTARDAYAKGVADGERKILTGLKAVAQLNGSAERLLKGGWDEGKHPRAADGRFGDKPGEHRGSADGGYTSAEDIEHPTVRAKFERLLRRAPEETRGEVLARAAAEDRRVMRRVEQLRSTAVRSPQTGDPLLVFHGTDQSFDRFADRPTFFTPSAGYDFVRRSPHVHAAYLDMRNPYRTQHPREVEAATYAGREFIDELKAKGYDGIIYSSPDDITKGALGYGDDHPQMVVFSASQIIPVQQYERDEFDGRLEYDDFSPDGPVQSEALQAYRDAPEPVRKAEADDTHALLVSAMLQVAEDAVEGGDDPADALKALAGLSQDPDRLREVLAGGTLQKAWSEDLHPRDKAGRFISKEKLQAAKSDPELAAELRERVAPKDADKLEAVLSGDKDPGRTKRGEQRHQAQQRRAATESDRRRAHRLAMRAFEPGGLGYDDYEELAELLPSLTVEQLRTVRAAVGASWGGQRLRRQGMVDTLVAFARQQAAPPEQDAPGSPGWAARMMNREDEPSARVDAWESAKVDDAADRAERMGRWEADRPDSEAAGAVAGAARADLAGAKEFERAAGATVPKPPLPSPDVPEPAARPKPRPKKRDRRKPVRTLADAVRRAGGINPASPEFLRFFANAHEAVEYGIPLNLFNRETGRHPDQLVTELQSEGHLTVPDGADTTQYLFDQMVKGATSEHAILDEAKEKYLADLAREQAEYEAEHGTPPDAYEGGSLGADDLFADEDSGHRGAAGAAGEVPDGGEGSELGDFLGGDADFAFGANAADEPVEPAAEPPRPFSNSTSVSTPAGPKTVGDLSTEWRAKLGKRFGGVTLKWYGSPGEESPQVEVYQTVDGYHGRRKKLVATFEPAGAVAKPPRLQEKEDRLRRDRSAEAEAESAANAETPAEPSDTQPPAPAEPLMADPLMGRDAQLDIFGGSKRTPRPAKPTVQNSLIPREVERRVEGEETQRAIEAMRDAGNPPEGPHPASVPADVPQGGGQDFYSTLGRDAQRHAVLGRKLATAGALLPVEAVDYATGDGSRHVTAGRAEVVLTNRLGLTAADAKSLLAKIKPATTLTVGGNRKRPGYDVLDLFRAAGKLYEPPAGNNPESGHTPPPPANSPVTGQSGPDTGGEPNGRGQRLSDEVRGGAGGRGGAGVGAGDGPSPGDAPRPPGGSPTGEPAPAGGRPGNRGAGGGPGGGRPGGVAAGGAGAGGGPGGRGPAGGTVPPADGPGGGGGPGRANGGGEISRPANAPLTPAPSQPVAGPAGAATAPAATGGNTPANAPLPALMQPTPYGPQAVVSRGGLVVRDGTNSPSSPVDKPSSTEYTAPESKPSGGKPMSSVATSTGPGVHKIPVQTRLDTDDRGQGVIVRKTDVTEVPKVGTWYRGAVVAAVDKKGKTYHVTTREPTPVEQLAAKAADINAEIYSEQNRGRAPGKEHLDLPLLQAKHDLDAAKLRARGASADEVAKHGAKRPVAVPRLELARQPAAPWMPAGGFVSVIGAAGDSAIVHSEGYDPQTIPLASLRTVAAGGSNPWVKMSREDAQRVVDHFAGLPSGGAA